MDIATTMATVDMVRSATQAVELVQSLKRDPGIAEYDMYNLSSFDDFYVEAEAKPRPPQHDSRNAASSLSPSAEFPAWRRHESVTFKPGEVFKTMWTEPQGLGLPTESIGTGIYSNLPVETCPIAHMSASTAFARRADEFRMQTRQKLRKLKDDANCDACEHNRFRIYDTMEDVNRHFSYDGSGHESNHAEQDRGSGYIFNMPNPKLWTGSISSREGTGLMWTRIKSGIGTSAVITSRFRNHESDNIQSSTDLLFENCECLDLGKSAEAKELLARNLPLDLSIMKDSKRRSSPFDLAKLLFIVLAVFVTLFKTDHVRTGSQPHINFPL